MVVIKSVQEIVKMRRANALVGKVLRALRNMVAPGVPIEELEREAERITEKGGGIPAFKGYHGYPSSLCVSINEVVIHGIPHPGKLAEGDIVGIDFGVLLDDFYGDAALTVPVGTVSPEAKELVETTEAALYKGIAQARPGNRLGDMSHAIQRYVEERGFSVVREFTGHGIGKNLHEEPSIPNYGRKGVGIVIEKGMTFALEPMVNAGSHDVEVLQDGWTVITKDGSLSAHFEHTVAIGADGAEILTRID